MMALFGVGNAERMTNLLCHGTFLSKDYHLSFKKSLNCVIGYKINFEIYSE